MSIVPGTNDAPGLFSTTNATPICAESCCVRIRISTSTEPPGADGTMKRMGFSGYAACAASPKRSSGTAMRERHATAGHGTRNYTSRRRSDAFATASVRVRAPSFLNSDSRWKLDGVERDVEPPRDRLVGQPLADRAQHFDLARREKRTEL